MISNFTAFLIEFVGTFIFIYVILSINEPIPIGLAFTGLLYFNKLTSGTYNPAATIATYLNQTINTERFIWFILAQVLGAFCAFYFYKILKNDTN